MRACFLGHKVLFGIMSLRVASLLHLFQWTTELYISKKQKDTTGKNRPMKIYPSLSVRTSVGTWLQVEVSSKEKIINIVKKIFEEFFMETNIAHQILKYYI